MNLEHFPPALALPEGEAEGYPQARDGAAPLRLLEVVTRLDVGGVPAHLMLLLEGLRARAYDITIACGDCSPEHAARLAALGVSLVRVELRRLLSPTNDFRGLVRLYRLVRHGRFDIVHTHMSKAALLGGLAGWLARGPVKVNTAHNLGSIAMPKAWLRALFWVYDKILLSVTMDAVITVSDHVRDTVLRSRLLGPDKVFTIPNGVRSAGPSDAAAARAMLLAELGGGSGRLIVGTVARLVWFKGLDVLVAAAAMVVKSCPESVFVVVGDGPLRAELERQAQALGVARSFVFLGERRDVARLLRAFDVFVLPSVSEGMPVTILEAMDAATPVIATRVGGVPELVDDGETGLLVPPRDPEALGAAILRLLESPRLRADMGERGRERVARHFSAERMVTSTDLLFRRLLTAKSGTASALGVSDGIQNLRSRG